MCASLLQQVFQSVVISKLTYAAPAWWGFSTSADRLCFETSEKKGHLVAKNFIIRLLYKDTY